MNQLITPFHALNDLHRELNRAFDDRLLYRSEPASHDSGSDWVPQVDISEDQAGYTVVADVPGIDPADVEITLHNNVLTIRGERGEDQETEDKGIRRRERVRGSFMRRFTMPESVDETGVTATAANGVLKITIPRVSASKPLSISVAGE